MKVPIDDNDTMPTNAHTGLSRLPAEPKTVERRRAGRMETESVACNLGPVLDLSATGMRVLCWKTPRSPMSIHLTGCETKLTVQGELAWTRRVGLFRKLAGIHFVGVTPEQSRQLTSMAMVNTVHRFVT